MAQIATATSFLHQLDADSLSHVFRFCESDELIALYGTHRNFISIINELETSHMTQFSEESSTTDQAQPTSKFKVTRNRLQIYHPSYTIYLRFQCGTETDRIRKEVEDYLIEKLLFGVEREETPTETQLCHTTVLEREILKSDFVKELQLRSKKRLKQILYSDDEMSDVLDILNCEFEPYTSRKTYLTEYYERFTLRLVIDDFGLAREFLSCEQQLEVCVKDTKSSCIPKLLLGVSASGSGGQTMERHVKSFVFSNGKYDASKVGDLTLLLILNHLMPKYYFDNYRVSANLPSSQNQALVDYFYHELLNNTDQKKEFPVFKTNHYYDTKISLFNHGLEMCFDLIYNQLSFRKKIGLIEKLIFTYLDTSVTPNEIESFKDSRLIHQEYYKDKPISWERIDTDQVRWNILHVDVKINHETNLSNRKILESTLLIPVRMNGNYIRQVKHNHRVLSKLVNLAVTATSVQNYQKPEEQSQPAQKQPECVIL